MASRVVTCPRCGRKNRVADVAAGVPRCGNCHGPLPWIAEAGDLSFHAVVEQSALPVVVDLWASWCAPCRMVSPALDRIASDLAGRMKLVKVDVDNSPRIAQRFAVQAVPTLLIMRGDRVLARQAGAPANTLRGWVEQALTTAAAT
jgi:thioredoxin 2